MYEVRLSEGLGCILMMQLMKAWIIAIPLVSQNVLPLTSLSVCVCSVPAASLLKGLKHANIVLLHDIIHTKETLTLVFEYVVRLRSPIWTLYGWTEKRLRICF